MFQNLSLFIESRIYLRNRWSLHLPGFLRINLVPVECLPVWGLRFSKVGWEKSQGKHKERENLTWKNINDRGAFGATWYFRPTRSPNTDRSEFWASQHHVISLQMGGLCVSIAHIMKPHTYCRAHSKACSFHRHYIL